MYRVTSKLTSGQNTRINTVNVNESVNNTFCSAAIFSSAFIHSKIKIDNRDTQPPLKLIPMIFPSSFKGVCQKLVILVTLTSLIWPGDVFWLRPCELYNNSSLVRYKPHKKYVTNTIGVHLVHYMVYNMLIISQIMKVFTGTALADIVWSKRNGQCR